MANRRQMVLAVAGVMALAVLPSAAYAGGGGSPPAPGAAAAGSGSDYCCVTWTPRQIVTTEGKNTIVFTVLDGLSCNAVDPTATARNSCGLSNPNPPPNPPTPPGKVVKCRGEIYHAGDPLTPKSGSVERCFSP